MCGIVGIVDVSGRHPVDADSLRRMNDSLFRRGPDDAGYLVEGRVGLAMRRLSIIDLATGHQPIHNEDKTVSVVFNGELYNYRELAAYLSRRGHRFATTSDTEVLVHLYEEHGERGVERLRGMFAFALWDRARQALVLARDRLGIKPLYYATTPQGFVFASELHALVQHPGVPRHVRTAGVAAYLRYGYVPDPLTILYGVHKLPPGHVLVVRDGAVGEPRRYWRSTDFFRGGAAPHREEEAADALWEHVESAVRSHLVSDVPVGAFLSGGVDSTAVVALMTQQAGAPVQTFSVGFREPGYDELPWARRVAERFGTDHHELVVAPHDVGVLDTVLDALDEPLADASAIPTYLVSRLARHHVKVVLTGDGGDELFAGYDRYVVDHRRRLLGRLGDAGLGGGLRVLSDALPERTPGRNYLYNLSLPRAARYLDAISIFPERALVGLVDPEVARASTPLDASLASSDGLDALSRFQDLDLNTYLPGDILTKVDRMSMANSLEARVPLLDHKLVEFACALPARLRLRRGRTKYLLRRALRGRVPDEVLTRPKQGFGVPLRAWFGARLPGFFREALDEGRGLAAAGVCPSAVGRLVNAFAAHRRQDHCERLWALVVLDRALRRLGVAA
jgi:asparagine synthase (glutamine-hydrolysing)